MPRRKLGRDTRRQIAAVEAAGGTVRYTRDGHVVFHAADGAMIGRSRATAAKSGRASRDITADIVRRAAAAAGPPPAPAPARPPARRPAAFVRPTFGEPPPPAMRPAPTETVSMDPPKEGPPRMEKTILVCDACAADGRTTGAVDSVTIESMVTGRKAKTDACQTHLDAMFALGAMISAGRRRRVPREPVEVAETNGHRRTFAVNMRCPSPANDGYEGPGQGMFQHVRNHHPDMPWNEETKEAARAAYQREHGVAA